MESLFQRLKQYWDGQDKVRRLQLVGGVAMLVVMLTATAFFAFRPQYVVIYEGLSQLETAQVKDELDQRGIANEVDMTEGVVRVAKSQKEDAYVSLSLSDTLPQSSPSGMDALSGIGMMVSSTQEDAMLREAAEDELAESISQFENVDNASVHIAPGKDSPVMDEKEPPTATVRITESNRGAISGKTAQAIARFMEHSIDGLSAHDLSVINQHGDLLYDGPTYSAGFGGGESKREKEIAEAKQIEQDLKERFDTVFGSGNVVPQVNVVMDFDSVSRSRTIVEPLKQYSYEVPTGVPGETRLVPPVVENERAAEGLNTQARSFLGGIMGMDSNRPLPGAPAAPADPLTDDDGQTYEREVYDADVLADETYETTEVAVGAVKAVDISVLANASKFTDLDPATLPEEEQHKVPVNELKRFLGGLYDAGGVEYEYQVALVTFDQTDAKERAAAAAAEAKSQRMQQIISMLPILVLLILGLFVVKAISRALPKPEPATALAAASPGSGSMTYNVSGGGHSGTSPGQRQAIAGAVGAEGEETTAADHDPDVAEALQRFHSAPEGEEDVALEDIHEKVDVPLEQIKKLSKQRPETVAMLLKGWMMDDRR